MTRLLSCLLQASLSVPESTTAPRPLTANTSNVRPNSQAGSQGLGDDIRSIETATPWSRMAAAISPSPALVMPTALNHTTGKGAVAAPSALSLSLAHRAHYLTTGNLPSLFASFAGTNSVVSVTSAAQGTRGTHSGVRVAEEEVPASPAGTTLFPDTPLASSSQGGSTGGAGPAAALAQRAWAASSLANMSPIVRAGTDRAV